MQKVMKTIEIETKGLTIGNTIDAIASHLEKSQLGFFIAEQVLIKMAKSKSSTVYVNETGEYIPLQNTEGYKTHREAWNKKIDLMEKVMEEQNLKD